MTLDKVLDQSYCDPWYYEVGWG